MSFQPRAGMSEGFSAERPRPPSVRDRLLRRRRSDPDSSRPSGRWRSILHVSVSLFAIAVARLLLGYFGRGVEGPRSFGSGPDALFDTQTNFCLVWCRTTDRSIERKWPFPDLGEGRRRPPRP